MLGTLRFAQLAFLDKQGFPIVGQRSDSVSNIGYHLVWKIDRGSSYATQQGSNDPA
jgi:hypothetical protein